MFQTRLNGARLHGFIFIVGLLLSLQVQAQECDGIKRTVDKNTGRITINSPHTDDCRFTKVITKRDTVVFIMMYTPGDELILGQIGVSISLRNQKKIDKPAAKVSVDLAPNSYRYGCQIALTREDIAMLRSSEVVSYKIFKYSSTCTPEQARHYHDMLLCVLKTW